nr:hypothetical protein HmN_000998300 [Hymenolepis microstoma]
MDCGGGGGGGGVNSRPNRCRLEYLKIWLMLTGGEEAVGDEYSISGKHNVVGKHGVTKRHLKLALTPQSSQVLYLETSTPIPPDGAIRTETQLGRKSKTCLTAAQNNSRLAPVSSDISELTQRKTIDDLGSGHKSVIASITINSKTMTPKMPNETLWKFKKADRLKFTNLLETELNASPINYSQHPDQLCTNIINIIIKCAKKTIPNGKVKHYRVFWFNNLEELKIKREVLRNTAEQTEITEDVRAWRRQSAVLRQATLKAKRTTFNSFISNMVANAHSDSWLTTDSEIANSFARFYSHKRKKNPLVRNSSRDIKKQVTKFDEIKEESAIPHKVLTEPFSSHELNAAIKHLKCKKSPGEESIHPEFLLRMGPKAKEILLTLFNKIWETSLVPTQWKVVIVIPILKKGKDPSGFDNYRPIFLTSMLAKLMERMVNTRLTWFLETNNILGNEQAGFRPQ